MYILNARTVSGINIHWDKFSKLKGFVARGNSAVLQEMRNLPNYWVGGDAIALELMAGHKNSIQHHSTNSGVTWVCLNLKDFVKSVWARIGIPRAVALKKQNTLVLKKQAPKLIAKTLSFEAFSW
jgi:hypothetical protein